MRTAIYVDGREIENAAGLRALVGAENIVVDPAWGSPEYFASLPNCCLCAVDVEATATKAGYACERSEMPGDYVWTPPPSTAAADER